MNIVHLTASPFFGGPERQMLGLARAMPDEYRSIFLSYAERGLCRPFLEQLRRHGFEAIELRHNAPRLNAAVKELSGRLRDSRADVLCCHGYKPDIIGLIAARRVGVPIVAVSRGWTAATLKVRLYDWLDRASLHAMDRVVCVSEGQAAKVRRLGVPSRRIEVIRNAVSVERFGKADPTCRSEMENLFPHKPRTLVGAAGRFSPEKGFGVLVQAARHVVAANPEVGFVLCGDGPLRDELTREIARHGLEKHFALPGFRPDLDRWLPSFDLVVLPSFTEGMPNIVLEAFAAAVPVVATAVGGTPEIIEEGKSGFLVPTGDSDAMAAKIISALESKAKRRAMGECGLAHVRDQFTFQAQSAQYESLYRDLGRPGQTRQARQHSGWFALANSIPKASVARQRQGV